MEVSVAEPVLKAGSLPGVKVGLVEAGVTLSVKATDDVAIAAASGEHGVKGKLYLCWQAAGFAAGPPALRFNGGSTGFGVPAALFRGEKC